MLVCPEANERCTGPMCAGLAVCVCVKRVLLLWLLRRIGFASAAVVPPPQDAHEQLARRRRVVVAALR